MPDYVIVGAGSAGCTLAARLSEAPDVSVTLIEADAANRATLHRQLQARATRPVRTGRCTVRQTHLARS